MKTQADQLRELLAEANLSQRAAARELGVSQRDMRYWCAGQLDVPAVVFLALTHLARCPKGGDWVCQWCKNPECGGNCT